MTEYQKIITDKVTSIINDAEKRNDWKGCHAKLVKLIQMEMRKSFYNGMKWSKKK